MVLELLLVGLEDFCGSSNKRTDGERGILVSRSQQQIGSKSNKNSSSRIDKPDELCNKNSSIEYR
jgi:hypothetical protein